MARLPKYQKIANDIESKIQSGEYKPGDALPSESQLREQFSVSRVTVRQALKQLIDQGICESIHGRGTYVKESRVNYDLYQQRGFLEKLSGRDVKSHSDVVVFEITTPSPKIAKELNIEESDKVFFVKRVRYIDENPVTVEDTWMPLALFPDLTYKVMQGSKYDYIELEKNMVIDHSEQEVAPILPPEDAVKYLGIPPEQPILEKVDRGFLADGTVFEYSVNYLKSADYKFTLIAKRAMRNRGR